MKVKESDHAVTLTLGKVGSVEAEIYIKADFRNPNLYEIYVHPGTILIAPRASNHIKLIFQGPKIERDDE